MGLFKSVHFEKVFKEMDETFDEAHKAIEKAMGHVDETMRAIGKMDKLVSSVKITEVDGVEEIEIDGKRYREVKKSKKGGAKNHDKK